MTKRLALAVMIMISALIAFSPCAHASDISDTDEILEAQINASGARELYDRLPDDTEKYLRQSGIDDIRDVGQIQIEDALSVIGDIVRDSTRKPLSACVVIIACIMICAMVEALRESTLPASPAAAASTAAAVAVCTAVMTPIAQHIEQTCQTLLGSATFAAIFSGVMAAVMSAGGSAAAGSAYSAFMLAASGMIQSAAAGIILPVIRILLSVAALSSFSTVPDFSSLIAFTEKHAKTLLAFLAMLFVGILSVSCVAAGAADSAALKAARFAVSTAVPVVGGSIGDAVATIKSCVNILRSSVGGFGIIALAFTFLPVIIRTIMWSVCTDLCSIAAELFGVRQVGKLLSAVSSVLAMLMAVTVFVAFVFIAASAVALRGQS